MVAFRNDPAECLVWAVCCIFIQFMHPPKSSHACPACAPGGVPFVRRLPALGPDHGGGHGARGFSVAGRGLQLPAGGPDGSVEQGELDLDDGVQDRGTLMSALDDLNRRYGRGTVTMGSAGTAGPRRQWSMRQERKTPDYTTSWKDMPMVLA